MRIFIHNCDSFIGKAVCRELRHTDCYNRLFGTVSSGDPKDAPGVVKRIVSRKDAKAVRQMESTLQSCKIIVYDLHTCTLDDLYFLMKALKIDPETGRCFGEPPEVTVVLISSVLVWAETDPSQCTRELAEGETAPSGPFAFKEGDWEKRTPRPGSKYEEWKKIENMMRERFNRPEEDSWKSCRLHIVSAGLPYGNGEEVCGALFKASWLNKAKERAYWLSTPGMKENIVPMVHVLDLGRLIRQMVFFADITVAEKPFLLAVDDAFLTQREVVQGVIDEMCDPVAEGLKELKYTLAPGGAEWTGDTDVETLSSAGFDVPSSEYAEYMLLNLRMEPSELMLKENFAEQADEPAGWWSRYGIVANMRKVAKEFCKERKLQSMRTVLVGSKVKNEEVVDLNVKGKLAAMICDHWSIPNIHSTTLEDARSRITSNVCRYRGYVLHGFPNSFEDADQLFREDEVVPKEEGEGEGEAPPPAAEGEGEEGAEAVAPPPPNRVLIQEMAPEFVIMLRLLGHIKEEGHGYDINLTDFFLDNATTEVFKVKLQEDPKDPPQDLMDMLMESSRIYMENTTRPDKTKGRPHNYLKTEKEIIEELQAEIAEKERREKEAKEEEERKKQAEDLNRKEEERKEAERVRVIAEYEKMQRALREMPLRSYLMQHMVPSMTEGLIEVCKTLPEDPVEYLASYLEAHAAD